MSKKDIFVNEIEGFITEGKIELSDDAATYFSALKCGDAAKEKQTFTDNGRMILQYMRDSKDRCGNLFKAKDIGEGLGISSRTASGAMRKLVSDAYIEKLGESPVVYALTQSGEDVDLTIS